MRNIFLFLLVLLSCEANAQGYFSGSIDSANRSYTGVEPYQYFHIILHNNTGLTKNYKWTRTDICPLPSGWNPLMCDCDACYTTSCYEKPSSGSVADSCGLTFEYFFSLGAAVGWHTTKLDIYDPADSLNSTTSMYMSINNGCSPTTISETTLTSFSMYPAPCTNQLHISLSEKLPYSNLVLCDVFGRKLMERKIGFDEKDILLPLENFASGLYFIHLSDAKHLYQITKKIQKL